MEGIDALPLDPLPSSGDDVLELVVVAGVVARVGLFKQAVEFAHRIGIEILEKRLDVVVLHAAVSIDSHVHARTALVAPENGRLPRALDAGEEDQDA